MPTTSILISGASSLEVVTGYAGNQADMKMEVCCHVGQLLDVRITLNRDGNVYHGDVYEVVFIKKRAMFSSPYFALSLAGQRNESVW